MEYVYVALLLHKLDKEINEENVKRVVKATGVEPDEIKVKALVSALREINIDEALKSSLAPIMPQPVAATPATPATPPKEEKPAEKKVEEEKKEESLEGLSALFG
jgi:large subunit ribosomal protein L12